MKQKLLPIVLVSLLLGVIFNYFFLNKPLGVSVVLFAVLTLASVAYFAIYYRKTLPPTASALAVIIFFYAAMVSVRASGFLTFLNVLMVLYLFLLMALVLIHPSRKLKNYTFWDYCMGIAEVPVRFAGELFTLNGELLRARTTKTRPLAPIVRGILITLPILLIFLLLFSSADLIFKHALTSTFRFHIPPEVIRQIVVAVLVAAVFAGAYTLLFTHSGSPDQAEKPARRQIGLGTIESNIVLGSVNVLFLLFVTIQITYLFGGQRNISIAGLTYAQYARRGFFELIIVAVISLALLLALHKSTIRKTVRQSLVFKTLGSVLIALVMLIMLSASKRLALYEQAYGFTELRLYSHLFIGLLAAIFVLLFIHIIRDQKDQQLAFRIFIAVVASLAVVNFLNPDAWIARANINRYQNSGKIDTTYLAQLSEDAMPATIQLLHHSDKKVESKIADDLLNRKTALQHRADPWQSFNLSRHHALQTLQQAAANLQTSNH